MILTPIVYAIESNNLAGAGGDIPILRGLEDIFRDSLSLAIPLAGIILFMVLLFGGFRYITSGSDPGKVESARKTITYAIFGIILFALSYLIIAFITAFTGSTDLQNFRIRR
jgi:amino acid transporter